MPAPGPRELLGRLTLFSVASPQGLFYGSRAEVGDWTGGFLSGLSNSLLQYSTCSSPAAFQPVVVYTSSYFFVLLFVASLLPFL